MAIPGDVECVPLVTAFWEPAELLWDRRHSRKTEQVIQVRLDKPPARGRLHHLFVAHLLARADPVSVLRKVRRKARFMTQQDELEGWSMPSKHQLAGLVPRPRVRVHVAGPGGCEMSTTAKRLTGRDRVIVAALMVLPLTGHMSPSFLAKRIVSPPGNKAAGHKLAALAKPLYVRKGHLYIPNRKIDDLNASLIAPRRYDFKLGISYRAGQKGGTESFVLLKLPEPSFLESIGLATGLAGTHSILRSWISKLKPIPPKGTIIMMPAYGLDKDSLIPWALFFARMGWNAIVVNLRGQGSSKARYLTWGTKDAGDIRRLVALLKSRHLLVKPLLYFGVSYGAGVALMAAAHNPQPDGVIAIAPWSSMREAIPRYAKARGWLHPGIHAVKWAIAEKRAGALAGFAAVSAAPALVVGQIRVPVLYLGGESDVVTTPKEIEDLAGKTPRASVSFLPGVSHGVATRDLPGFCRAIVGWLLTTIHSTAVEHCDVVTKILKNHKIDETYMADRVATPARQRGKQGR